MFPWSTPLAEHRGSARRRSWAGTTCRQARVHSERSNPAGGNEEVAAFIRTSFRSVWDLELLCHLRRTPDRNQHPATLVAALRASDLVVANSLAALLVAGLIVEEPDRSVRFAPASAALGRLSEEAEALYRRSPDAVRRMIVTAGSAGIAAFADAFRLRKD